MFGAPHYLVEKTFELLFIQAGKSVDSRAQRKLSISGNPHGLVLSGLFPKLEAARLGHTLLVFFPLSQKNPTN
ncbi:hypothetical protein [Paraburkholderia susongensis]|uniref:hypothetical protein n=1 Tax=Paraburkholderia susongensis TaxID=1515439 RepID=UPI00117DB3A3|nr:hypothetical protein [Paraburkholderia susongensis]